MGKKDKKRGRKNNDGTSSADDSPNSQNYKETLVNSDGEGSSVGALKNKRTKKFKIKEFIKQQHQPRAQGCPKPGDKVVIYDSDEIAEYDPAEVNQDPGTIYNAASQVLQKLTYTQKKVGAIHREIDEFVRQLE